MENSNKTNNNNNTQITADTIGHDVGDSSMGNMSASAAYNMLQSGLNTDSLEFTGHMKSGLTEFSSAGSTATYLRTAEKDCETIYRPPPDLFNRLTLLEKGSINPGKYGFLISKPFNEGNLLSSEAARNATGYTGFRADLVFTLVVAAPPQASGILKMAWWPMNSRDGPSGYDKTTLMPMYSQTLNVELNLAEASTVTLKVPYNFYSSYLRINPTSVRRYGFLGLGTYLPIGGAYAASSIVSYSVYISYENVELINPGSTIEAQSGYESKAIGPVTQIMRGVTRLAQNNVGTPIIGAYAKMLAWVSGGVGAVAAHYGWSKPNDAGGVMMQPTSGRNHLNVLGVSNAADFGMYSNNCVKPIEDIGTLGVDEMALCHLTCIPSPIFRGNLTVSNLADSLVYSCQIAPYRFWYQESPTADYSQLLSPDLGDRGAIIPTPIFYLGEIFNYWRGDLVFRVKFARSKFSAGRVLIGYNPKPDSSSRQVFSGSRINYNSVIADFRTDSVVDLEVPYSYPFNMCSTYASESQNTGIFFIRVLDPIIVPAGVSPDMPFIVEVFSKCGLVFGGVSPGMMSPASYTETLKAQSGFDVLKDTIGEAILSVKQLMMRPTFAEKTFETISYVTTCFEAFPAYWDVTSNRYIPDRRMTLMNLITPSYRFYHGGVVLHALSDVPDTTIVATGPFTNALAYAVGRPVLVEHEHNVGVKIPFWSQHKKWPVSFQDNAPNSAFHKYHIGTVSYPSNSDHPHMTSFVAGDDFQLGSFTGFNPVVATGNRYYGAYGLRESDPPSEQ